MPEVKKPTTWSYSSLTKFEKCPAQWKYAKIDRLPDPSGPAAARGSRIHAQLERALKTEDAGVPEVSLVDYVAALRLRRPEVEVMWHFDRDWQFLGPDLYEPGANRALAKASWLLVKMDAYVAPTPGRKPRPAHVVDWKTGKIYPDHEQQGELYAVSSASRDGGTAVDVDMVYVDQAHVEKWRLEIGAALEEMQGEWAERAEKMLTATEYRAKPGQGCHWCSFSGRKKGPCRAG